MDFWKYYPDWVQVCAYGIASLSIVPHLHKLDTGHIFQIAKGSLGKDRLFVLLAILSGSVFWVFRQKYGLLGDGYLRISEALHGHVDSPSRGSLIVLGQLHNYLSGWDQEGVFTFQVFSIFWGVVYTYAVFLWADKLGGPVQEKITIAGLMIFLGSAQYFFGYLETYAPLPFFALVFGLSGVSVLKSKRAPIWPLLWFACGFCFHTLTVMLLPGLLFLWWLWIRQKIALKPYLSPILNGGIILVFLVVAYGMWQRFEQFLLVIYPTPDHPYAIMTGWHLWEWMNIQILSTPVAWPLLFLFVFLMFKKHMVPDSRTLFLSLSAGGPLVGLFVIDPVLGSRDWDLMSFSGVPMMLLVTDSVIRYPLGYRVQKFTTQVGVVFAAFIVVPWIHLNHTDRSLIRVREILVDDPGTYYQTHPSDMVLGVTMQSAGVDSLAIDFLQRARDTHPTDPRMPLIMGNIYAEQGENEKAIFSYIQILDLPFHHSSAYEQIFNIIRQNIDRSHLVHFMYGCFKKFDADQSTRYVAFLNNLGTFAFEAKDYPIAAFIWHTAYRDYLQSPVLLYNLGAVYLLLGERSQALRCWQTAHLSMPENVDLALNLTKLYKEQHQMENAIQVLKTTLALVPGNKELIQLLNEF